MRLVRTGTPRVGEVIGRRTAASVVIRNGNSAEAAWRVGAARARGIAERARELLKRNNPEGTKLIRTIITQVSKIIN